MRQVWEPPEHLANAPKLVQAFHQAYPAKPALRLIVRGHCLRVLLYFCISFAHRLIILCLNTVKELPFFLFFTDSLTSYLQV